MITGWLIGPVVVTAPAWELWDHASMVSSLLVLSLPLVTLPAGAALPLLPPDVLPQTRLVGSGKWGTRWKTLLLKPKAGKKSAEYFSLLCLLSPSSLSPYTAELCLL